MEKAREAFFNILLKRLTISTRQFRLRVSVNPEISVVMPVFNRKDRAATAISSVLEQRDVRFELIVVDDASTEPASQAYHQVESAGHRVVRLLQNVGPGQARNEGARLATGEWLAFLDSDDYWLPGKLSAQLQSLRASGLNIGQTDEIWYRDGVKVNPPKAHRISGGDLFARSLKAVCVSSSTVVLRTSLFREFGGFDDEFFVCEDYDLWLRVAHREKFDFCSDPLVVKYGGHDDQLSKALPAMDRFRILSLVKGLSTGAFKSREDAVCRELERKLRILSKGAAKRGLERPVELCAHLTQASLHREPEASVDIARRLVAEWPLRT